MIHFLHSSSHLVTVPPGPVLSDALLSSPIVVGEDGAVPGMGSAGFEFGVDPNEDPELALVSRTFYALLVIIFVLVQDLFMWIQG